MRGEKQQFMFTPQVLQTIIDKKLTMYQYFDHLHPILKSTASHSSHCQPYQNSNNKNAGIHSIQISPTKTPPLPLPIAIPKIPQQTANILRNIQACSILFIPKIQSYSYQTICQCLESASFIQKLHPYINSLLTTTNIGIIKQTLTIYSIFQTQMERILALNRITEAVNILTLYQIQKNVTNICCTIQEINGIFGKIGLMCTEEQYTFYYEQVWAHIKEEIITLGHALNSKKQTVKYLQIYDILSLAIQMLEISLMKTRLIEWMNSQDFEKYQYQTKIKRAKQNNIRDGETNKRKDNKTKDRNRDSIGNVKDKQIKQLMEENLDVVKMRIKYMGSMDLIKQLKKRGYQIDKHYQKYVYFRKQYLQITQQQHKVRKFVPIQTTKSTKNMPLNPQPQQSQFLSIPVSSFSKNPSSFSNSSANRLLQNPTTLSNFFQQQRHSTAKQNQKTREQQQFNKKVLNGYFVREFIHGEIVEGNAQAVVFQERMRDSGDRFTQNSSNSNSNKEDRSQATTQSHINMSHINMGNQSYCDFVDVIAEKENRNKMNKQKTDNKISTMNKQNLNTSSNKDTNNNKKKMQMNKMCSIDFGITFSEYTSSRPETPQKRQNKIPSENYYNNLKMKVKSQPFFGLGAKILMR